MKKIVLIWIIIPFTFYAQTNTFPASGNVGIGTTSPHAKLTINIGTGEAEYPTTTSKGNVLEILRASNNDFEIGNSRALNGRRAWILARHSSTTAYGEYYSTLHLQPDIGDKSRYRGVAIGYLASTVVAPGTHLAVNGNVGIGTITPDAKLTVKGKIHTQEVKVDLNGAVAPDYVFKEDYSLRSLEEVQAHIKEKGHLPGVPSAKEMEDKGINLKEMNLKLLEKVEELTLYTLQQQNDLSRKDKRINNLEDRLKTLEKLIFNKN